MKVEELRKQETADLNKRLLELLREHFNLRMQHGTGQLAQTHQLTKVRRDIARTRTILREKEVTA